LQILNYLLVTNNKTYMKRISNYIVLAFAVVFLTSCAETEKKKDTTVTEIKDTVIITEANTEVPLEKMASYPIPTPYETAQMLQKAGAGYVFDLTNPTSNVDKYIVEKQRAINLGIYGADLGYAGTYKKLKEVKDYFKAAKKLSEDLEINTVYTREFGEKLEANLEDNEKLHNIVTQTYYGTFAFLNDSHKAGTASLILLGGWIETMYLSTQLAVTAVDNKELLKSIAEQKASYAILAPLLKLHSDKEEIKEMATEVKALGDLLNSIENDVISPEQIKTITAEAERLRNKVTMN